MTGEGKLKVLKTTYFDIIYPQESENTALSIADVCDGYYLEIASLLDVDPSYRFPVTITHSVESLNAYFTPIPYNRIVLYDVLPSENLDMMSDTMRSVFYHELTHAVTLNIRSKSLEAASSLFGDVFNPAWISLTSFWNEGATVSFESMKGEGRLNDPYSLSIVNQAKIEGKFPSWRDVTGARDTYPGGEDAYMFGASFADYLQKKYGMKKYADFWLNAGSGINPAFCASVFKKTYGVSLDKEWAEYTDTLVVPCVIREEDSYGIKDYIPRINDGKTLYTCLDTDSNKTVFYDKRVSAVYLYEEGKLKKLFYAGGITNLKISPDGRYLAVSRTVKKETVLTEVFVYSIYSGKIYKTEESGLRDAYFSYSDTGELCLSAVKTGGSPVEIKSFTFNPDKPSLVYDSSYFMKDNVIPFSPVLCPDGKTAFIIKEKNNMSFLITENGKNNKVYKTDSSTPFIFHKLHGENGSSNSFIFSYAVMGQENEMLPRQGKLIIDEENGAGIKLCRENISGGVSEAVLINDSMVYISSLYEENQIKTALFNAFTYDEEFLECSSFDEDKSTLSQDLTVKENVSKPYRASPYLFRGILVPFSTAEKLNENYETEESLITGLTYITGNPWGGTIITLSGGFNPNTLSNGYSGKISISDEITSLSAYSSVVFDGSVFSQTRQTVDLSRILWSGFITSFSTGLSFDNLFINECEKDIYTGLAYTKLSHLHKASSKYGDISGFYVQSLLMTQEDYYNAGATLALYMPFVFPLEITGNLYPSKNIFASGAASAVLYTHEIHKGIKYLSLYAQRLVFTASYSGKIKYPSEKFWDIANTADIVNRLESENFSDTVSLNMKLLFSPNTSFFASSDYTFSVNCGIFYHPSPDYNQSKAGWSLSAILVY